MQDYDRDRLLFGILILGNRKADGHYEEIGNYFFHFSYFKINH